MFEGEQKPEPLLAPVVYETKIPLFFSFYTGENNCCNLCSNYILEVVVFLFLVFHRKHVHEGICCCYVCCCLVFIIVALFSN